MNRSPSLLAGLMIVTLLAGCSGQAIQRRDGSSSVRSFSLKELAKGDVDTVVEIHQQEIIGILRTLTLKFCRRNPEGRRSGFASAESATETLFNPLGHVVNVASMVFLPI